MRRQPESVSILGAGVLTLLACADNDYKLWTEEEGFGEHHPLDEADIRHFRRGCETTRPLSRPSHRGR